MGSENIQYRRVVTLDVANDKQFVDLRLRRENVLRRSEHVLEESGSFRIPALGIKALDFGDIVTAEVLLLFLDAGEIQILIDDPGVKATGTLTAVAVASLIDGETFALNDGQGTNPIATTFELDLAGDGVTAGRERVNLVGAVSAADVSERIANAINLSTLGITAVDGAGIVALTNDRIGPEGNTTSADTVADAGFIVTNMTGGLRFPVKFKPLGDAENISGRPGASNEGVEATKIELRNPVTGGEACGEWVILGRITT